MKKVNGQALTARQKWESKYIILLQRAYVWLTASFTGNKKMSGTFLRRYLRRLKVEEGLKLSLVKREQELNMPFTIISKKTKHSIIYKQLSCQFLASCKNCARASMFGSYFVQHFHRNL